MKKFFLLAAVVAALSFNARMTVRAVDVPSEIKAVLHSGKLFLPPPPEIGSPLWLDDSVKYKLYKEPRLKNGEVNYDSIWAIINEQYYFALYRLSADSVMDVPLIDITWTNENKVKVKTHTANADFPAINALEALCDSMKSYHTGLWRVRQRPYYYFNDFYGAKRYSRNTANASSYPSGHGYFRGLFGKCMEVIDPEHNDAVQKMLDEWLHCRLQRGAHWNTDLIAGKQLGEIAFDSAMTVDAFRNQVLAAREELKAYRLARGMPVSAQPETSDIDAGIGTYLAALQGSTATSLTINRIMYKDGFFNTLCLPFSLDAEQIAAGPLAGCELFEFESAVKNGDALELNVSPVADITAGHPYLVRWKSGNNILSMTFSNVLVTASVGLSVGSGVKFVGTIGQAELSAGNGNQLFLGANNTLYWPDSDNSLKGFRAYFLVTDGTIPAHSPARLVLRPDTPSGIDSQTVSNPAAGKQTVKLIEDAQLIIIVDGVRYNIQGNLVK